MKKVTKRERKALRGPNAAMKRSIRDGQVITMSDRTYRGRPMSGIPFVRVA